MIKLKLTSIQLHEETKKRLEEKKAYPRESYDSIIKRVLESEDIPSMEDMFRIGDKIQQKKKHSAKETIELTHQLRNKR
ncbi:hypothetical protein HYX07_02600 [Candidatus Woesearchaeota archaeon]|nr:hypothetical protein [Candidatus Woesearchaeota archaeon]